MCNMGTNLRKTLEWNKLLIRYLNHVIEHWKHVLIMSKCKFDETHQKTPFPKYGNIYSEISLIRRNSF